MSSREFAHLIDVRGFRAHGDTSCDMKIRDAAGLTIGHPVAPLTIKTSRNLEVSSGGLSVGR